MTSNVSIVNPLTDDCGADALRHRRKANATIKIFDGATPLGSAIASGTGAWSFTTAALANGTHNLTATATHVAGNTGVARLRWA